MTEQEWLACADPRRLLDYLEVYHKAARTKGGRRKLRLLACACCRRLWHLAKYDKGRRGVEVAERYADRLAGKEELRAAREVDEPGWDDLWSAAQYALKEKPQEATGRMALHSYLLGGAGTDAAEERRVQCGLVRETFGNPFRPVTVEPAWQAPQVVALAQAAYDNRDRFAGTLDPARLAALADGLDEAGCADADVLNHLRGPGPHVRGCWAVDLLLGKG
jgi:hypothetical protein